MVVNRSVWSVTPAVGDDLVAQLPCLLGDGQAPVLALGHLLVETLLPAAEEHIDLVVDALLGDGAGAALGDGVGGALGHVGGALAGAVGGVRGEDGRGGVGQLGGGHRTGRVAALLRQFQNGRHGHVGARRLGEPPVDGLHAGRPAGAAGRGVGDVVRSAVGVHRVGRVRAGQREPVHVQAAGRAHGAVAGEGDLRVAHAVTDEQDDVLRPAALDGALDVFLRAGRAGRRREGDRGGGGDEDRTGGCQVTAGQALSGHGNLLDPVGREHRRRSPHQRRMNRR